MEHEELTRLGGNPDQHVRGIIGCLGAAAGLAIPWAAHVGWRMVDVFGSADDDRFHRSRPVPGNHLLTYYQEKLIAVIGALI